MNRRALFCLAVLSVACGSHAQVFTDNFTAAAGTPLTALGWNAHRSAGVNPILVSDSVLHYAGYPIPAVCGSAAIIGRSSAQGEDIHHAFTSVDSGSVYVSCLVKVPDAPGSGDYFLHLGPSSLGTTYRAKLCVRSTAAGWISFGITKSAFPDTAVRWTVQSYASDSTHLLVMRYTFAGSSATDDTVALWVDPPLGTSERSPDLRQTDSGSDLANIGNVILRQGSTNSTVFLDGLRIGTRWGEAPLPVQLTALTAKARGNTYVDLHWVTRSEIRSYGFIVHRASAQVGPWNAVSPLIGGHGTSMSQNEYDFTDTISVGEKPLYKLKQLDLDGGETWSESVSVAVTMGVRPASGNQALAFRIFPNPCNPTTRISFRAPGHQYIELNIYSILGQHICTLFSGITERGEIHNLTFDGSQYAGGVYLCVLEGVGWKETTRLILVK